MALAIGLEMKTCVGNCAALAGAAVGGLARNLDMPGQEASATLQVAKHVYSIHRLQLPSGTASCNGLQHR